MDTRILIAAHKPYRMPDDPLYLPIQVGAERKPVIDSSWQLDNAGENISGKNPTFCELTALYWAWKNLDAETIGLCHYRRYFSRKRFGNKFDRIAGKEVFERAFQNADVILPCKRHYWIETNYSQYVHAHHEQDLIITREIIQKKTPDYIPAWENVMARPSGHRFNMFVMKRAVLDAYCAWLFEVLFTLEQRLDIAKYEGQSARTFGLVGERLLDVWLENNRYPTLELPTIHMESQHWPKKIYQFLKRKIISNASPKQYE